jgi:ABC-type polysaccharide/polyol phosphate export permease
MVRSEAWSALLTALALAGSSIRSQARKHLLGYSWAIFSPVIYAACFLVVKRGIGQSEVPDVEHSLSILRAFVGVTMMQAWIQLLQEMSGLIRRNKSLLRGMNISEKPLVLAVLLEALFGLGIRSLTVLLALAFLGLKLPAGYLDWVWIAVSLLVLLVSSAALGFILAPWAALYPDVKKAISSATLPLMLLSPVFYVATTQTDSVLFWVNCINPVAPILATLMDAFSGQAPFYKVPLLLWLGMGSVLLVLAMGKLKRQIPILLERLGS